MSTISAVPEAVKKREQDTECWTLTVSLFADSNVFDMECGEHEKCYRVEDWR